MNNNIIFISSGRADLSLIRPVYKQMIKSRFNPELVLTGTHLISDSGVSINEIDMPVCNKVDLLFKSNSDESIANSIGIGIIKFTELFKQIRPKAVFIVGDRFEMLSATISSHSLNIPIIHAHAGEYTMGSLDNAYRDSITAMADIIFTSRKEYLTRVEMIKGDNKYHAFCSGALFVDNYNNFTALNIKDLSSEININIENLLPYWLVTIHPETNKTLKDNLYNVKELLRALGNNSDVGYIFTSANQDAYGEEINKKIIQFCKYNQKAKFIRYAGSKNYWSMIEHSIGVIGNSSSGIYEAPYFMKWCLNIGDRQKGRLCCKNVVHLDFNHNDISDAIKRFSNMPLPEYSNNFFGDGASKYIIKKLEDLLWKR